ncbi:MAG: FHA domain-containing protein [Rhizonema sp. NSF051]|nr:FHA domain-containing protein [Rhizonema sp. NSF051]
MKVKVFNSEKNVQVILLDFDEILAHKDVCLVGRSPDCDIVLDSPDISRVHGKFFQQNGDIYYTDIGSKNGSKVNDEITELNQNYLLNSGDVIEAGEFVITIAESIDIPENDAVIEDIDVTVFSPKRINTEVQPVENAGVLVKVPTPNPEDSDPKYQTKALFVAINQRIISELKAAGNLTREAYIKTVRQARETVENKKLIDPEELENEAQKYWQSLSKGTSTLGSRLGSATVKGATNLGTRLGSAAKAAFGAAWKEMTAPKSNLAKESSQSQPISHPPEVFISAENPVQPSNPELNKPIAETTVHPTHSEDAIDLRKDNQVKDTRTRE